MNALEIRISDLAAWRASHVSLCKDFGGSRYKRLEFGGDTKPVLNCPSIPGKHPDQLDMEREPEFQAAWAKVQEAVQGLHDAREAIIRRKALELANVVHGEQLNGIRALVDQIQEGAGS